MTAKYLQIALSDVFQAAKTNIYPFGIPISFLSFPGTKLPLFSARLPHCFSKVTDASLISRFKYDFESHIETMFQQMLDFTELICQLIDASLAQILTFDTSGIELYIAENFKFPD